MIEILLLIGGMGCLCLLIVGAFILLRRETGGGVPLDEEAMKGFAAMLKGESAQDVMTSQVLQTTYPGAQVKQVAAGTNSAPPSTGFLLFTDKTGTITDIKGSGTIK